jgi:hypothetical protein
LTRWTVPSPSIKKRPEGAATAVREESKKNATAEKEDALGMTMETPKKVLAVLRRGIKKWKFPAVGVIADEAVKRPFETLSRRSS